MVSNNSYLILSMLNLHIAAKLRPSHLHSGWFWPLERARTATPAIGDRSLAVSQPHKLAFSLSLLFGSSSGVSPAPVLFHRVRSLRTPRVSYSKPTTHGGTSNIELGHQTPESQLLGEGC